MVNGSPNHLSLQRQPRFLLETGLLFLATVLLLADLFVSWRSPIGVRSEPEPSAAGVFAEPIAISPESSRSFFGALSAFFWSPARILMASCRNLGGARAEFCWSFRGAEQDSARVIAEFLWSLVGVLLESCRNHGGVFAEPCRHPVGVVPELWRSHGGALA
jgi:hypothetical protein